MNLFEIKSKDSYVTDNEWASLFEKLAEEHDVKSYDELENTVKELFHDNSIVNTKLEKWASVISLDRNKLRNLFKK